MEPFKPEPTPMGMTEAETADFAAPTLIAPLVDRARAGDPDAFVSLLNPLFPHALRLATAMLGDAAEAEDAVQTATANAWASIRKLRDPDATRSWFLSIVANECRRHLRGGWLRMGRLGLHREAAADAADAVDASVVVHAALRGLPAKDRTVVVLRYFFDLTLEDIAAEIGVPLGTVKSRLNRATARLHNLLALTETPA